MFGSPWLLAVALAVQSAPPPVDAVQPWPDDQPIERVFHNLRDDLTRLPTLEAALVIGAGSAGAIATHPSDDDLATWATTSGPTSYTALGRVIGDGWVQGAAAVGTYALGRVVHDPKVTHIGSDLIRAQVLNGVITTGVKAAVGRSRPSGGTWSFPSGHASAAFTSAAVLEHHFGWKVGGPAYAMAGFIAWTRIRDRAHWISDAVFGSAMGTVIGRAVTRGHRARDWTIAVAPTTDGIAFQVVRLGP